MSSAPAVDAGVFAARADAVLGHEADGRMRADDRLRAVRERALARFLDQGLPSARSEQWRSTNLAAVGSTPWRFDVELAGDAPVIIPGAIRIVLANGRVVFPDGRGRAAPDDLPRGLEVMSLARALDSRRDDILARLDALTSTMGHPLADLNAALFQDGVVILVAQGAVIERPIHLAHVMGGAGFPASMPRVLVTLGEDAHARVIETHHGDASDLLSVPVTEIDLGAASTLEHVHAQSFGPATLHVAVTRARVQRDATLSSRVAVTGGKLSRHDLAIELAGEGASCVLDGVTLLDASQHADHHTHVTHAAPRCTSEQAYRAACAGRSRSIFFGRVTVAEGARLTSAAQQSRNLVLSADALVDARPQLEILNDDVRCTHGATIGQLDEDALFYMRSRGLDEDVARRMLVSAFLSAPVDRIVDAGARALVAAMIATKQSEVLP